jgi:hypothetical protein
MVGVRASWYALPWYTDPITGGLVYGLPDGVTLRCSGGCGDQRNLVVSNPVATVKSYSVFSDRVLTFTNHSETTFNAVSDFSQPRIFLDITYSAFFGGPLGEFGAIVTDPSVEYAGFTSSVGGEVSDFHSCDTRFDGNPCGVSSPDESEEFFGFVPLLAPGHAVTVDVDIAISAELKGDLAVPEPPALPLFATGLGLMALLLRRRTANATGAA